MKTALPQILGPAALTAALWLAATGSQVQTQGQTPSSVITPDREGLRCISAQAFPSPSESRVLSRCDFENGTKLADGWTQGGGEIVTDGTAPQGKSYVQFKARKSSGVRCAPISAPPGEPCFLSYWIKTAHEPWTTITFTSQEREPSFTPIHSPIYYDDFPLNTGGQWRQEGFYFVMPAQCQTLQISINPCEDHPEDGTWNLDDVSVRTASTEEMAAAYVRERAHFPDYHPPTQPSDGACLPLSIAKWEGRAGIPGKPFVIWALGSSYTDRQGDGYELIRAIRERYPHAPPIIYRKHGGPGTPWQFVYTWVKQFVAAEQPDLIFTYTSGTLEGLDSLLGELRRRTTAEIIVPSLHFRPPAPMTRDDITRGMGVEWSKVRELCAKHHAEFVDNRQEMADYITKNHLDLEDLLADHNHQGMHGRIRIWDNVTAHLVSATQPAYRPEALERRIPLESLAQNNREKVQLSGDWKAGKGPFRAFHAMDKGARLTVQFTGNQIDLLGLKTPGGGTAKVTIDGVPADEAPVFLSDFIQPDKKHAWRIPHAVDWGDHLTTQSWTITMTNNTGDFRLEGSVTGPDGTGNLTKPFWSNSRQIGLPPQYWREAIIQKPGAPPEYGVATGDNFKFDVYRSAIGELSFDAAHQAEFAEPLARNLTNGPHTLELTVTGNGGVTVTGLYVYEPLEK